MIDIIINQTKLLDQIGGVWVISLLVFSRIIAFSTTAPLISSRNIPVLVKVSFAVLLTLLIMPILNVPVEYPRDSKFIYLIMMNVLIGLLLGWVANLVLEIGRAAGEMLDMQMALNAATIFDPGSQTQSTIVGRFFDFLVLTLFISIGGMEKLIDGLNKSFNTFPIVLSSIDFSFYKLVSATSEVIGIGFLIVSPVIILLLAVDLILGLMSRAAPQINAFQVSFSIKPSIALILVIILLPVILEIFAKLFSNPFRFF